tara:strand:- start:339 stop:698 length:360 start_codon:yes stop_codon:yes gene_type:complete
MIGLKSNPYNKPSMIATSNRLPRTEKKAVKKQKKARKALRTKLSAPGVPPITCPYIDEVIRVIKELEDGYEQLRTTSIPEPLFEKRAQLATDTLEYIRAANETLRDNSLYWYKQYKNKL